MFILLNVYRLICYRNTSDLSDDASGDSSHWKSSSTFLHLNYIRKNFTASAWLVYRPDCAIMKWAHHLLKLTGWLRSAFIICVICAKCAIHTSWILSLVSTGCHGRCQHHRWPRRRAWSWPRWIEPHRHNQITALHIFTKLNCWQSRTRYKPSRRFNRPKHLIRWTRAAGSVFLCIGFGRSFHWRRDPESRRLKKCHTNLQHD